MMAITGGTVETLDEIPAHVWKGLPDCLSLGSSAVNQSRIGEFAQCFLFCLDKCTFRNLFLEHQCLDYPFVFH